MRIAFILPSLACTGPIIVARNLIQQLKKRAELIDVYYFHDKKELEFDCDTYRIDPRTEIPFDCYDIIHAHMLMPNRYLWLHRRKINAKIITTLHQFISYSLRTDFNFLASLIYTPFWYKYLKSADHIVYISESLKAGSYMHLRACNSSCIYNGIDISNADEMIAPGDLEQIKRLKQKYKLIGNFSNFTYRKGIDQMINCLSKNTELALLLIGNGKVLNDLKKQAEKLNVADRCLFLGFRPIVLPYYKLLDGYVMPSRSEAFGLSLVEAAAFNVPIVCSDLPTFRELFDESEVCFFKAENINSLNNAINIALQPNTAKSANAFERYKNNYTTELMSEGYWKLYEKLIK
jgi:glycosyltransferase involved in cell wall biosynthesis